MGVSNFLFDPLFHRKSDKENEETNAREQVGEGADVYIVEDDVKGVWEVETIADTETEEKEDPNAFVPCTLQIEVDNSPGVLNQVPYESLFG